MAQSQKELPNYRKAKFSCIHCRTCTYRTGTLYNMRCQFITQNRRLGEDMICDYWDPGTKVLWEDARVQIREYEDSGNYSLHVKDRAGDRWHPMLPIAVYFGKANKVKMQGSETSLYIDAMNLLVRFHYSLNKEELPYAGTQWKYRTVKDMPVYRDKDSRTRCGTCLYRYTSWGRTHCRLCYHRGNFNPNKVCNLYAKDKMVPYEDDNSKITMTRNKDNDVIEVIAKQGDEFDRPMRKWPLNGDRSSWYLQLSVYGVSVPMGCVIACVKYYMGIDSLRKEVAEPPPLKVYPEQNEKAIFRIRCGVKERGIVRKGGVRIYENDIVVGKYKEHESPSPVVVVNGRLMVIANEGMSDYLVDICDRTPRQFTVTGQQFVGAKKPVSVGAYGNIYDVRTPGDCKELKIKGKAVYVDVKY